MIAAQAAAVTDVTHPADTYVDVDNSSKMIGRVGLGQFFDPWVNRQVPTPVNPDEHPCLYEFIGEELGFRDIVRAAYAVTQNCPSELVESIDFEIVVPKADHVLHSD